MQEITLNNGVTIPILGFGVFQIPASETKQAVLDAIAAGYRHFDTAQAYANEREVGQAIAESGLPREEFFITSKVWKVSSVIELLSGWTLTPLPGRSAAKLMALVKANAAAMAVVCAMRLKAVVVMGFLSCPVASPAIGRGVNE